MAAPALGAAYTPIVIWPSEFVRGSIAGGPKAPKSRDCKSPNRLPTNRSGPRPCRSCNATLPQPWEDQWFLQVELQIAGPTAGRMLPRPQRLRYNQESSGRALSSREAASGVKATRFSHSLQRCSPTFWLRRAGPMSKDKKQGATRPCLERFVS